MTQCAAAACTKSCGRVKCLSSDHYCIERGLRWAEYHACTCLWQDVAAHTGIVLDPVYSGKAVHYLLKDLQANSKDWQGRKLLFIHTGGLLVSAKMGSRDACNCNIRSAATYHNSNTCSVTIMLVVADTRHEQLALPTRY